MENFYRCYRPNYRKKYLTRYYNGSQVSSLRAMFMDRANQLRHISLWCLQAYVWTNPTAFSWTRVYPNPWRKFDLWVCQTVSVRRHINRVRLSLIEQPIQFVITIWTVTLANSVCIYTYVTTSWFSTYFHTFIELFHPSNVLLVDDLIVGFHKDLFHMGLSHLICLSW
jgi:hypothetical protein